MKTAGIIGGIGPESTVDYYRAIVQAYRKRNPDGSYPSILINSIDLKAIVELITAGDLARLTDHLVGEMRKLSNAGADFGLLAANTPHIVFDDIQRRSPMPLISIVQATCEAARALQLKRLGLLGTRFTMQGRFYPDVFQQEGIALVTPQPDEQAYVHDKYMNELVLGIFLPETRERLLAILDRMRAQGVILAGTELPLLLRNAPSSGLPLLDTARIHVDAVVGRLLS